MSGHRRSRDERGVAALEFALLVLPLMLILGGIINFGVVFSQKLALDNAVRQAARSSVVDTGGNPGDIAAEAVSAFNDTAIATRGVEPTIIIVSTGGGDTCEGSAFGDKITVNGTFDTKWLFPWVVPGIPKSVELKSDGKFQCEYS